MQKIKYLVAELVVFALVASAILAAQCVYPERQECYFDPMAWLYMPLIHLVPAVLVMVCSIPVRILRPERLVLRLPWYVFGHAFVGVLLLKLYLSATGSDWSYLPKLEFDLFIAAASASIGIIASFAGENSKNSFKAPRFWHAPKTRP